MQMGSGARAEILERAPPPADRRIAYGSGEQQFGDLRLPAATAALSPAVIVLHGGFWRATYSLEHIGHVCAALTNSGFVTWNLEYRRIGQPGGGWPGTLQDVALGAAHLAQLANEYPIDLERVVVIGHSAGGHLALWLAAHSCRSIEAVQALQLPYDLVGAVALAGVADLRAAARLGLSRGVVVEFLGGSPDQVPDRYTVASPIELLPFDVPQVLIHGELDDVVPIEIARTYCREAARHRQPVTLTALPRTGHFELIDPLSSAWPPVLAAVATLAIT
jgi:acetyl esterase/lipase